MANHPSALKRYRQSQKRRLINSKNATQAEDPAEETEDRDRSEEDR